MPTNRMTDAQIRAAKPGEKAYKLFDGGGLHLFVSAKGAKVWRLAYRLNGRQQTMSLGPYPEVSLAEARSKRDETKAALRAGEDPMAPRRAKRTAVTFAEAFRQYWCEIRKDITEEYRKCAVRAFERHIEPLLGNHRVATVTRADLLDALGRMDSAGLHVYVRKTRIWVSQALEWAVENGLATDNPAAQIRPEKAFSREPVKHMAALPMHEVPAFMYRLSLEAPLQSVLATRLLGLTWVRTNELRSMEWSEVQGDIWVIPPHKMKRAREHVVPLSRQALALLDTLRARSRASRYVFPAEHTDTRPMSENAVLYLLYRMGYRGRMTGHGWRSIGSTWANERGYNRDAIERQLAHVPKDKTRAAYNRAEFLQERRKMLQDWADWLGHCEEVLEREQ